MSPPKVSIIILQYNNSEDTIRCLQAVKELDYPNFGVILVDNNSNPPHIENIKEFIDSQNRNFPCPMLLVANPINLGYAGGNNLGIKHALENNADYILILNNDTKVPSNLIEKLVETAESDNQIGIVGPLIKEGDKTVCGGKIKWLKPELKHIKDGLKIKNWKLKINEYIPGICMLIKRQTLDKIGLLPEEYFLYFEDADYCLKAHKMGLKCAITHETTVNHQIHGSTSQLGSPLILRYHFRNSLYFNRKNGPLWAKIGLWPWSFWVIAKQLLKLTLGIHREHSRAILSGVMDFYFSRIGQITSK